MSKLLSINSYHYRRGGADVVYFEHAKLLESLGWQNGFFSMHYPDNIDSEWSRYFIDELQFGHQYSLFEKLVRAGKVVYSFEAQRKLRSLLEAYRPDIAHIHNIYHHLSPSILPVLRKAGIPAVMTAHDLKIACPNNRMLTAQGVCEQCKGGKYLNVLRNRCVQDSVAASAIIVVESTLHGLLETYRRNLDRIVVPSRFFLEKFVEWGWPREQFAYVPNYVDCDTFEPNYRPGDYFLYMGRLIDYKGVRTLVRAAIEAGVKLKIAGTGPLEAELKTMAEQSQGRVELLGYMSGAPLRNCVAGARAIVLPSEWYENAPLSVLESFATGKPVIGARIGGIPELIREGENGWLFDSGNTASLCALLRRVQAESASSLAAMGRNARSGVERDFSREQYVRNIRDVYGALGVKFPVMAQERKLAVV